MKKLHFGDGEKEFATIGQRMEHDQEIGKISWDIANLLIEAEIGLTDAEEVLDHAKYLLKSCFNLAQCETSNNPGIDPRSVFHK